jgi:MscS family membrane protein
MKLTGHFARRGALVRGLVGSMLVAVSALAQPLANTATNLPPATGTAGGTTANATWLTFGLDRVAWLQTPVLSNPLWQYLAALLYVLVAFLAAKVVDFIFGVQLKRLTAKTKSNLDDLLVNLARGPVKVITFVILLHVGLRAFAWPEWAVRFISNGLHVIIAASITYVALKLVDLGLGVWQKRLEAADDAMLDMHLFPVISKSLKAFVVIVAVLVTTQNLGMNVTGLLASLSIGGLAVGLAAQDTLSNLFGAVALFADKPFRIGDRIQLDAIDGTVEAIGLRSTRVRNLDGHLVTVPNRTMANACITNISKRPNIKTVMNVGVTYDTPADQVERAMVIIEEIFKPHPKTADLIVSFNKFNDSSLNIMVVHWWNSTDLKDYLAGFQQLNLELKRRFDAEGIGFAFPTQTVYVKHEPVAKSP